MKEYNRNHAEWAVKEINNKKGTPYHMTNEELADDIFPYIKEEFSDALMIKLKTESYSEQFIVVTKRARNALVKHLKARKDNYMRCIQKVDSAIKSITDPRHPSDFSRLYDEPLCKRLDEIAQSTRP
jgi:hypothetical protein